ncbi:MAG TPA: molybdopterin cofactor-binding domain-containing protein [Stellaceae bacterium]|nr:molybdopterin cofactor-binding domain-containing protein [Stellaceae bacterium]
MTAISALSRRDLLKAGGAIVVSFSLPAAAHAQALPPPGKTLDGSEVDGFLAIHEDGGVTIYSGKVDLGTGFRAAIRQMVAEELDIGVGRIALVEGDTALTPDQGPTAGSTGITRGAVPIRQAAATARQELLRLASERLKVPPGELAIVDGAIAPRAARATPLGFGDLIGGRRFSLKVDAKAPLKDPKTYRLVGKPLPRPDLPAKATGRHVYVHDFKLPGMLHGRVVHPPAVGAKLLAVEEASIKAIPGARVVRKESFLGVVAEDEWAAVRAARELKASWGPGTGLPGNAELPRLVRESAVAEETLESHGDAPAALASAGAVLRARYYWPPQSHASMGPSCAVADVRADGATIWTASQATHKYWPHFASFLGLPKEKVRLVYLDGAGCYGMNGHDDAAADAALLSQAVGKPVRVQWMREDEHGWDPKGPPQLLEVKASLGPDRRIAAWEAEMWLPQATKGLPNIPLISPTAAGLPQPQGLSAGLITQNADPSYAVPNVRVVVHWLKDTPLRPSNIRAPGKIANSFAVESLVDELAAAAGMDALAFRLAHTTDPRGIEVLKRVEALMKWEPRVGPNRAGAGRGRGIAYVHYKHAENYVAIGMEVSVDRASGAVKVTRVACAHDCGLVVNPDGVRNQVEGGIVQTLSRALFEEVTFDRERVTSLDWASYPILRFPDAPEVIVDLVDRPELPPMGAGEAATAPVAAALANAIFDATGARLRDVPMTPERVKAALQHA